MNTGNEVMPRLVAQLKDGRSTFSSWGWETAYPEELTERITRVNAALLLMEEDETSLPGQSC